MIVNVHRRDTPNCGDLVSAPLSYLHMADVRFVDILMCSPQQKATVEWLDHAELIVLGGGGLLDHGKFAPALEWIAARYGEKTVLWGAGSNRPTGGSYCSNLQPFILAGIRDDADPRAEWVPCASCLYEKLSQYRDRGDSANVRRFGIVENDSGAQRISVEDCGLSGLERMGNKKRSYDDILEFISTSEWVVTSSYHVAYWSVLIEKPVIAIPSSSKFYKFKHPVPLADKNNWINVLDKVARHVNALEECQESNAQFMQKIRQKFPRLDGGMGSI